MLKKTIIITMSFLLLVSLMAAPAVGKMKDPVIKLERVEIATMTPFFVQPRIGYKSEKEPGKTGGYGYSSIMGLAYIFAIENPNRQDIMLDELTFTVAFEGFDVHMPQVYEDMWIPGKKTNYLRVHVNHEALPMMVNLMVGSIWATKIKEIGTSQGALVKKWWDTVGDFTFPIEVKYGAAVFQDKKGEEIRVPFSGKWPK
jgi:hypothetical protein